MSKAAKRERQRQNREAAREAAASAAKRTRLIRSLRSFGIVAVVVVAGVAIFSFVTSDDSKKAGAVTCSDEKPKQPAGPKTFPSPPPQTVDPTKSYTATLGTTCGTIVLGLDAKTAPVATNNFVFLARQGYYDGTSFERAAKDFVIQGGDRGKASPGYTVNGEVPTDHYPVGAVAAAKGDSEGPGAFGSTFFIVTGPDGATTPNDFARFGSLVKGLDVAQKIESFAPATGDGPPSRNVYILKVSIKEGAANTSGSTAPPPTPGSTP